MKKNKLHNNIKSGFKTPEGYFDSLEEHIMSELKLKELSNSSGFKTPDNYFSNLEDTITSQVSKKETKVIKLFTKKRLIYISGIAAAILLLFNVSIFNKIEEWPTDFQTVETYILEEDINYYDIATLLDEDELIEDNFIDYTIKEETVEDYIIDNLNVDDLY